MTSIFNESGHVGEEAIMREVVFKYHSRYKDLPKSVLPYFLNSAQNGEMNVAMLLEEAMAQVGGLVRSKQTGEDFTDASDAKFVSLNFSEYNTTKGKYPTVRRAYSTTISNLKNKNGRLRVVLWNDCTKLVEFYLLPYKAWKKMVNISGKITLTASIKTGKIVRISKYKVNSFEKLCKKFKSKR